MRECSLGELITNHNAARRPIKGTDRIAGATPYYGASGIVDCVEGFTHDGEYLLISEDGENLRSRTSPIGFVASGQIWVNNHAHVVAGREPHDTRFLQYALAATDISGYLTGSAQPKLTKAAMESIRIRVPSSPERRAIADVLCSLDDKLTDNNRVVAVAENLMVAIAEGAPTNVRLGELVRHSTTAVDPLSFSDVVAHYSLPAFDEGQRPVIDEPEHIKSIKFLLAEPCVLVSKLNPRIPRIWDVSALPIEVAVASTEFVVAIPIEVSTSSLWAALRAPRVSAELESLVAGTSGSHQRVKPAELLGVTVKDPRALPHSAQEQITATGALVHGRRLASARLAAMRDELLPLLISGKVRVRDAAKAVEGLA